MKLLWLRLQLALRRQSVGNLCAAFLLLVSLCAWFFWLPLLRGQSATTQAELRKVEQTLRIPPALPLPEPLPIAEKNLDQFYKTLGEGHQTEQQLKMFFSIAKQQGLILPQGEYKTGVDTSGRYLKYQILFPVKGSYGMIRQFCEKVLMTIPFASLDELNFKRDNIGNKVLEAKLRFTLYLSNTLQTSPIINMSNIKVNEIGGEK